MIFRFHVFPSALACLVLGACDPKVGGEKENVPFSQATILGATGGDSFVGMATEADGSVYLAGTSKELVDRFYADLTVAKVGADGTLAWARSFGGDQEDGITPHVDSEGEGPARMVAAAPGGGVFVVGRTASITAGFRAALIVRLSSTGSLVWARAWRPHWRDEATGEAMANAVAVSADGNTVYVVGTTGGEAQGLLLAYAVDTGTLRWAVSLDPSPGFNDRLFSVVPVPGAQAIFVSGWQGQGNEGLVMRVDVSGALPSVEWAARVRLPMGSTLPDLDVDAQGNLYAAADIHGATTHHSVLKLSPTGSLLWARDYNAGNGAGVSTTHVVRAFSGGVLVGGRVAYPGGSDVETDRQLGDSVWMVLNADGALVKDAYYFTGQDGTSGGGTLDRVRGLAVHNGQLVVMGNIYTNDAKYSGTWRTPASRDISPAFGPSTDVIMQSFSPGTLEDFSSVAPRTEAEMTALSLSDVTSNMVATAPAAADGAARATQGYVFWFNGVL